MQEQRRHIEGTFMAAVCTASVQRVAEIGAPRLSFGSLRSVELSSRRAHNPPPPPSFSPSFPGRGGRGGGSQTSAPELLIYMNVR